MKLQCKVCKIITNHELIKEHKESWDNEEFWGSDTWQIVRCKGCEDVSFRHLTMFSEDRDEHGNLEEKVNVYPIRGKDLLSAKDFYSLSPTIRVIYKETIEAFNIQSWTLCAIGVRAIIEGICIEEKIESGTVTNPKSGKTYISKNLDGKIAGLKEKGLLAVKHADLLHELRFLGNEAVHELVQPSTTELKFAIEIIDHTIENVYELEEKIRHLKAASRRRRRSID